MYERQFKFVVDYDYLIKKYTEHLAMLKMYVIKSYYTYILIFFMNVWLIHVLVESIPIKYYINTQILEIYKIFKYKYGFSRINTNFGKFSFAYYTYELMLFQGVILWFSVFPNYKPYGETEKQY